MSKRFVWCLLIAETFDRVAIVFGSFGATLDDRRFGLPQDIGWVLALSAFGIWRSQRRMQ